VRRIVVGLVALLLIGVAVELSWSTPSQAKQLYRLNVDARFEAFSRDWGAPPTISIEGPGASIRMPLDGLLPNPALVLGGCRANCDAYIHYGTARWTLMIEDVAQAYVYDVQIVGRCRFEVKLETDGDGNVNVEVRNKSQDPPCEFDLPNLEPLIEFKIEETPACQTRPDSPACAPRLGVRLLFLGFRSTQF